MSSNEATQLAPHECWDLLRSVQVGRLAVVLHGRPEIFPVNFVVDRGTVVFRTAAGSKLAGTVSGPGVAFEADGTLPGAGDAADDAWSVVVKGSTERVESINELTKALDLPLHPWHASPKFWFVRIVPLEVTGRRFTIADASAWVNPVRGVRPAPVE
jgi:uncharacterized protein